MAKKSTKASSTRSASKADSETSRASSGDKLVRAVWHNGKLYNPKNAGDQAAFRKLVESEKKAGDKNKDGSPRAQLDLQALADAGHVSGFGTKASTKKAKAAKEAEVETSDLAGGDVDALDEQEAMEQEREEG